MKLHEITDRLKYVKKFPDAPSWSPGRAESYYKIGDVTFAARDGLGAVPFNESVYYHGFVALIRPSVFIELALPDGGSQEGTAKELESLVKEGYAIGIPFLDINLDDLENNKGPAKIKGHEGRGRMRMVMRVLGNDPIPIHVFLRGGLRNRDLTPELIDGIKKEVKSEDGSRIISRPFTKIITAP